MKIGWGYRILILYAGFAGMIILLVVKSMNQDVDLVSSDYYNDELKHQEKIESISRNNSLSQPAKIEYDSSGILITLDPKFKGEKIEGTVVIFRPSDQRKDESIELHPNDSLKQLVSSSNLSKGLYRVKLSYNAGNVNYYSENKIVIR